VKPTRQTAAGRAYLDLQNLARRSGRPTEELLSLYVLEGFLARLSASGFNRQLILKGGVLLAAFDVRRPTRDVDLQALDLSNDVATVLALVRQIAAIATDDGLEYLHQRATVETIRDEGEYAGVRVNMVAILASATIAFHVDINVGDPISPAAQDIELPRILGGTLELRGYPLAMVHAEKIVTAVSRGTVNTRWRDFGDIYTLSHEHPLVGGELTQAITTVAVHRGVDLQPLGEVLEGWAPVAQGRYSAWRRKHQRTALPEAFQDVLDAVTHFADPAITGDVSRKSWDPVRLEWM